MESQRECAESKPPSAAAASAHTAAAIQEPAEFAAPDAGGRGRALFAIHFSASPRSRADCHRASGSLARHRRSKPVESGRRERIESGEREAPKSGWRR